jgi:hypothetical protein
MEARMSLRIAASGDARALAIRDNVLPLVRAHGMIQDLEGKDSTLRLIVLDRGPWRFTHWTPFNALAPNEASSPGYRHALERQRARPDLTYGLDIRHDRENVLSLLWADCGAFEIVRFVRGAWEDAALEL